MRLLFAIWLAAPSLLMGSFQANRAPATDCVDLGTPKPALTFVYRTAIQGMGTYEYTHKWDELTTTASRLVTARTGPGGSTFTTVNQHRVVDDVFVVDSSTSTGKDGERTMSYKPGSVRDPAFRACAGKSWDIPAVEVTTRTPLATLSFATQRDQRASLMVFAVDDSVTVPAGTFKSVRYVRTRNTLDGQMRDEVWKSIEHGVMVKQTITAGTDTVTDVLIAIR
jgi:hypothetical protein